jgi:hypothetical protein
MHPRSKYLSLLRYMHFCRLQYPSTGSLEPSPASKTRALDPKPVPGIQTTSPCAADTNHRDLSRCLV